MRGFKVWVFSCFMLFASNMAMGQSYPRDTIRMITGPVGSGSNLMARMIAQGISPSLGQPIIVDNRTGLISIDLAYKAKPDGYTLLLYGGVVWIEPLLRKTEWDAVRDFQPVALTTINPNVIVVHPSLPVNSVKELIAFAKARPAQLNYGSASAGASSHLAAELFNSMANVKIVGVLYRGNGIALIDLMGGQIQVVYPSLAEALPHVKSGRLRALATGGLKRSQFAPDLPTVSASGLPDYKSEQVLGIFAPAKTPMAIITRLNDEVARFLDTKEAKEQFFKLGSETAGGSPEQFGALIKAETAVWSKVIKDAGIRVDN